MNYTLQRIRFYQIIAALFSSPTPETSVKLASGVFISELTELSRDLPCSAIFLAERASIADFKTPEEDINAIYTTSFEVPNPPVSLSESGHFFESIPTLYEDLYRIYEYFGLNFKQGTIKARPDVLTVELDFMQYLVYLESHQQHDVTPLKKAQHDFLDRHLSRFVDSLVDKLKAKSISPYQELGVLLKSFVAAEKAYLIEFRELTVTEGLIQTVQLDTTSTIARNP